LDCTAICGGGGEEVVVVYIHRRQTVNGVLKDFVNKLINLNWMNSNKHP
jgi:hypothetical protein